MTNTRRVRLSTDQISRRLELTKRQLQVKMALAIRQGRLTKREADEFRARWENVERTTLSVGSTVEWDGALYMIEGHNDDGVIMSRIPTSGRPQDRFTEA